MAIYEVYRPVGTALSTRIASRVADLVIGLIDARNARATERALSKLSDHELWDIGLGRCDIPRVANRTD